MINKRIRLHGAGEIRQGLQVGDLGGHGGANASEQCLDGVRGPVVGGDIFGRGEQIAGKPVPALVYKRREHVINLFVLPAATGDVQEALTWRGYSLRHWKEGDLGFWAVTDAAQSELADFERIFRAATSGRYSGSEHRMMGSSHDSIRL